MNRRGFLGSILVLGVAPAIVRASSLMPVRMLDGGESMPVLGWPEFRTIGVVSHPQMLAAQHEVNIWMTKQIDAMFAGFLTGDGALSRRVAQLKGGASG